MFLSMLENNAASSGLRSASRSMYKALLRQPQAVPLPWHVDDRFQGKLKAGAVLAPPTECSLRSIKRSSHRERVRCSYRAEEHLPHDAYCHAHHQCGCAEDADGG